MRSTDFWARLQGLQGRLAALFLALALLPLAAVGTAAYRTGEQALEGNIGLQLEVRADRVLDEVEDLLDASQTSLRNWSNLSVMYDLIADDPDGRVTAALATLAKESLGFDRLLALSPGGTVLAASEPALIGSKVTARTWFRRAKEAGALDQLLMFEADSAEAGYHLVVPVKADRQGEAIAWLSAYLSQDRIRQRLLVAGGVGQSSNARSFHLVLFGKDHVPLIEATPHDAQDGERGITLSALPVPTGTAGPAGRTSGWTLLTSSGGRTYLVGQARSAATGNGIAVLQPTDEAFEPIYDLRRAIIVFGLILTGLVVPVSWMLAASWAKPILILAEHAGRMAEGTFPSDPLPEHRQDEIGILSRAFQRMTEELRRFTQDLEQRVAERTAELAQANRLLERAVVIKQEAEKAAREYAERLRLVADHAPVFIAQVGQDYRYHYVNQQYADLFGLQAVDVPGKPVKEVLGEQAYALAAPRMVEALNGQPVEFDLSLPQASGAPRTLQVRYVPERNRLNQVSGFIAAIIDVTDRKQAETMLRRLATIIESSDDAIISKDLAGLVTSWNRSAERLLGYEETEMLGCPIRTIIPEDRQTEEDEILVKLKRGERIEHFETVRLRKDGTLIDVSILISPIKDGQGVVVGASKIMRDNRERKLMKQALRDAEARTIAFLNNSLTIAWMKDAEGRMIYLSPNYERRFQVTLAEWRGKRDAELWPVEIAEEFRRNDLAVLANEKPIEVMEEATNPDGSRSWWLNCKFPFTDAGGVRYVGGLGVDITERVRAERTFKDLLEAAPDSLVIVDTEGRMVMVNQQTERVFGYARTDLLDRRIEMLLPERFRAGHAGHRTGFFTDPRIRPMGSGLDLWARHQDGHEFPVEISLSPLETESGRLVTAAIRDVSERKAAYEAVQAAHRRLQELSRQMGLAEERVRGVLSRELHDEFGQLLSALKYDTKTLGSGLARRRALTEATRKRLAAITQTVDRLFDSLHTMVRGLRPAVLEKLGLGVALESLVEDTEARFRLVYRLETEGLAAPTGFGAELEATLYRMTQELLTNVTRHAKASQVTIRLESREGAVALTVADDGVGFASSSSSSSSSSSERYGLRGIRERAEMLGGQVAIDSQPGVGTTVSVRIPLRDHKPEAMGPGASHASPPGLDHQESTP